MSDAMPKPKGLCKHWGNHLPRAINGICYFFQWRKGKEKRTKQQVQEVKKMKKWCCSGSWGQICTSFIWQCSQIELLTSLVFRLSCYSVLLSQSEDLSVFYEKTNKPMHNLIIVINGLFSAFQCVVLSFIPECHVSRESVLHWQPFALTVLT